MSYPFSSMFSENLFAKRFHKIENYARNPAYIGRGWDSFLLSIRTEFNVPEGRRNECILYVLGLDGIRGIDLDPVEGFSHLSGSNLDEIREEAKVIAIKQLREQITEFNTYFLEVERMIASPFSFLIEDIIEARKQELEQLSPSCTLHDVLSTYYGYRIFTTKGPLTIGGKANVKNLEMGLKEITEDIGVELKLRTTAITKAHLPNLFQNCSEKSREILNQAVRIVTYSGTREVMDAVHSMKGTIGKNADWRMADAALTALRRIKGPGVKNRRWKLYWVLDLLGYIGCDSATRELMDTAEEYPKSVEDVAYSLARIPGQDSTNALLELHMKGGKRTKERCLRGLVWRDIPELEKAFSYLISKRNLGALNSLLDLRLALKQAYSGWDRDRITRFQETFDKRIIELTYQTSQSSQPDPSFLRSVKGAGDLLDDKRMQEAIVSLVLKKKSDLVQAFKIISTWKDIVTDKRITSLVIDELDCDNTEIAKIVIRSQPLRALPDIRQSLAGMLKKSDHLELREKLPKTLKKLPEFKEFDS
ncbi:MAG: hypothetical protein ACFFEU_12360 [Candidatus Thorarchaeota archaeon]